MGGILCDDFNKRQICFRVMIDFAEYKTDGYIPIKEVAARQEISLKYLERIFRSCEKRIRRGCSG